MSEVLEEHYDYLSLRGRAELYDEAIAKIVKPGGVVADLGCGFGVLGLQCIKAGAARVYGIDASGAIHIARESIDRAGLADRYSCIEGSTFLIDLPEKVDLIICDHVGWFGFDYDIIPMLQDAKERMLKPGGTIMPASLRLSIAGTSATKCRENIDRWAAHPIPEEYHWVSEYQLNKKQPHEFVPAEICTEPVMIGEIDLQRHCPDSFTYAVKLQATTAGQFNGIAGWFDAELTDGVWMTNSPLAERRIARNQVFLAAREPFPVEVGDTIEIALRFRQEGSLIAWSITPPGSKRRQKLSTWNSMILSDADLATPQIGPVTLTQAGRARSIVLHMVDGSLDGAQIEDAVVQNHPDLFPSEAAIRRFVRAELARWAKC